MIKPPYILSICGIRENTAHCEWYDRAKWFWDAAETFADSFEYETLATLKWFGQSRRVKELAARLALLTPYAVSAFAHSNGCDLITTALRQYPLLTLKHLHLISAACDADFNANGLNAALKDNRVERVFVHGSPDDSALELASVTKRLFGFLPDSVTYGDLGREGPKNLDAAVASRVVLDFAPGRGHSTLLDSQHLTATLSAVADGLGITHPTPTPTANV